MLASSFALVPVLARLALIAAKAALVMDAVQRSFALLYRMYTYQRRLTLCMTKKRPLETESHVAAERGWVGEVR